MLSGVSGTDSVMQEEIFGPILPIITVESMDQAIEFVRGRYLYVCVCVLIGLRPCKIPTFLQGEASEYVCVYGRPNSAPSCATQHKCWRSRTQRHLAALFK